MNKMRIIQVCLLLSSLAFVYCGVVDNQKFKRGLFGLGHGSGIGHLGSGSLSHAYGLSGASLGLSRGLDLAGALSPSSAIGGPGLFTGNTNTHSVTTINRPVAVPVPQPVPVHIDRPVAVPVPHPVPVDVPRPYPVSVPQPYPVTVTRTVPIEVPRAVPVPHPVPFPVSVSVPQAVAIKVDSLSGLGLGYGLGGHSLGLSSLNGLGLSASKGIILNKGW